MTHRSQAKQGQCLKNTLFCEVEIAMGKNVCWVGKALMSIEDSQG